MEEFIKAVVGQAEKLPKRERGFRLALFKLFLEICARLERAGISASDATVSKRLCELLTEARSGQRYSVYGVRVPSIIRTYKPKAAAL